MDWQRKTQLPGYHKSSGIITFRQPAGQLDKLSYQILHIPLNTAPEGWIYLFEGPKKYVVFWWEQIPLGQLYTDTLPAPSRETAAKALIWQQIAPATGYYVSAANQAIDYFEACWMSGDLKPFSKLFASALATGPAAGDASLALIICTRNRTPFLEKCLQALQRLRSSPDEIIVVDNAPDDSRTETLVKQYSGVTYVCEPRKGLDFARNRGIAVAKSALVAFTDDDVELHEDWVARIRENFRDKRIQAVTGIVFARELETRAQILFEKYWSFNRGYLPKIFDSEYFRGAAGSAIRVWEIGAGASMAFRKSIFEAVGLFDERLDMGAAGCNGDSEIWYRILAAGWKIRYDPLLVAHHTHRREPKGFRKQIREYLRGFTVAVLIQYHQYRNRGDRYHLFHELPRYYLRSFFTALLRGFRGERTTVVSEIRGYFSGLWYYLRHRKDRPFARNYEQPFPGPKSHTRTPLVSIIITTYNHAKYLPESIESVTGQTYQNIELIIVDDGSVDDTREVVARYPQARYHYQQNQGLAAARNTGIFLANGEMLVFLDADDWLYPDAVALNLAHFSLHPDAAFVSGWFDKVSDKKEILHPLMLVTGPPKDRFYAALLTGNYIGMHATVMYQRRVFTYFLYDVNLKACEDYDLYLRVARIFKIHAHPRVVAGYRIHENNMSGNIRMMLRSVKLVLTRHYRTLPAAADYPPVKEGIRVWERYYAEEILHRFLYRDKYPGYQYNLQDGVFCFFTLPFRCLKALFLAGMYGLKKIVRAVLPLPLQRWCYRKGWIHQFLPRTGRVKMGDFQRVTPFDREFGYNRGGPVDRYYIEEFLNANREAIRGNVLEIGDNAYTLKFGDSRVDKTDILHVDANNPQATIIGDLSDLPQVADMQFDCIILTQTLHLIYDHQKALATCYRILKNGGTLLLTVPGITNIDPGQWRETWYWSFTGLSVSRMLEEIFLPGNSVVKTFGNVLAATGFLYGMGSGELSNAQKDFPDPGYPVVITARAIKNIQ